MASNAKNVSIWWRHHDAYVLSILKKNCSTMMPLVDENDYWWLWWKLPFSGLMHIWKKNCHRQTVVVIDRIAMISVKWKWIYFSFTGIESRTARVLMLLVVPGHLIFMVTIYSIQSERSTLTFEFVALYLLAAFIQVIEDWLVVSFSWF